MNERSRRRRGGERRVGRLRCRKYYFLITALGFCLLGLLYLNIIVKKKTNNNYINSSLYNSKQQLKKKKLYYIFDTKTKEPSSSEEEDDGNTDDTHHQVWIVKWIHKQLFNRGRGRTDDNNKCDIITERIQNRLNKNKNRKLKILIIDRGDTASFHKSHCPERISKLIGSQNLYLAVRNMVVNRNFGCMSIVQPTCYSENTKFTNLYGTPWDYSNLDVVKHIHNGCIAKIDFPVRDALLTSLIKINMHNNNSTTTIKRTKDVAHFWDIERNNRLGQLRNRVTEMLLLKLIQDEGNNITGTARLVSKRAKRGRTYIDQAYVKGLLEHKIIVVAQRDHWEGHLRLMEAMISGGLVLSDPIIHPPSGMVDGKHYVTYNSLADLKEKVLYYSSMKGSTERERIAKDGKKLVLQHHKVEQVYQRMVLGRWPNNCSQPVLDLIF